MFRKMLVIGVLFFTCNTVLSLFSSCTRHRTSSGTKCKTTCFAISSADLSLYDRANQKVLEAPYTVKASNLIFKVTTKGVTDICMKPKTDNYRNLSFFSTAYAVVPEATCFIRQGGDSIVSYNIYSDKAFDNTHPAGSSLKDVIETNSIPAGLSTSGGTIAQITYEFFVDAEPAENGTHIFTIELLQRDGNVTSIKTPAIQLQK